MAGDESASAKPKNRILEWLDVFAKLLGASAVLLVALFANSLQGRLTGASIQSQREQAESQLRASMFNSLISPISGPQTGDKPIPADREVVITELLALNFNENFEMKPLLEDANKRLAEEFHAKNKDAKDAVDPREGLWSIMRLIAEKQKASISREWSASNAARSGIWPWSAGADPKVGCEVYYLNLDARKERNGEPLMADSECQVAAAFGDIVDLKSPDGHYTLRLVAVHPNWTDQEIKVSTQPFLSQQAHPKSTDTQYNFNLSWLDLPLTDNTLLSDGNRYAAYIRSFYNDFQTVSVTIMWFPRGYFTPRERPLNYTDIQALSGAKPQ